MNTNNEVCAEGCDSQTSSLFCPRCGHLLESGSLQSLRFDSFRGMQSLSPGVQAFLETGDPARASSG